MHVRIQMLMGIWAVGLFGMTARGAEVPAQPDDWLVMAQQAQAKGLAVKAMEFAGKAVEALPKDPRTWYFRASLLQRSQQWAAADSDLGRVIELTPAEAAVYKERGVVRLRLGKFQESVADFDRFVELRPNRRPELWERGIALFYARRFAEGRQQFELHRTVNPHDVENAAWHFACVAQAEGFAQARAALIPVEGDSRVPMKEIQLLLAGKVEPEDVLAAAEKVTVEGRREEARFYARLYLAMFEEARGKREVAAKHIAEAVKHADDFGIMGEIGRLHASWLAAEIRRAR